MTERDGLFLAHILAAIADIESFTAEGRSGFIADSFSNATRLPVCPSVDSEFEAVV